LPIVSLEGPDKSGKTTLFQALQGRLHATFVPTLPMTSDILKIVDQVERCFERLWISLYDPSKTYIVDRHMSLTNVVYGRLYGRPVSTHNESFWRRQSVILYLDCPLVTLKQRWTTSPDPLFDMAKYERLVQIYREEVRKYRYIRLDASRPIKELIDVVKGVVGGRDDPM